MKLLIFFQNLYFSSLFPVKSAPLISNHIFALYTQQNFCSVTVFQIKRLSFQEKCNKCLNQSELKLMREWGKKPHNFRLLYGHCCLSASHSGSTFLPGILKGLLTRQEVSGDAKMSEPRAVEKFCPTLDSGKNSGSVRLPLTVWMGCPQPVALC